MTIEHVREYRAAAASQPRWASPEIGDRFGAVARWWRVLVLKRRVSRMLGSAVRRPQRLRLEEMPDYLLRDIGLPPDLR